MPRYERSILVRALAVSDRIFDAYVDGTEPMPLDRQVRLAHFIIENGPPLARAGYQLLGQALAALALERRETTVHSAPPVIRLR